MRDVAEITKTKTGRTCGGCTLCCKLLEIEELGKPAGKSCRHCNPGEGCAIYESRPPVCQGYACEWLLNRHMPDSLKPSVYGMVFSLQSKDDFAMRTIYVNPRRSGTWRQEPYYAQIKFAATRGLEASPPLYTQIKDSGRTWVVLADLGLVGRQHLKGAVISSQKLF